METIQSEFFADAGVGNSLSAAGLNFKEAMNDFRTMFPTLDDDVIEAVLRSNRGNIDHTVDQLLTMSNDCQGAKADTRIPPICTNGCISSNSVELSDSRPALCTTFLDPMVYVFNNKGYVFIIHT